MNSAVQGIHYNAIKHSRRAARLWRESAALFHATREATIPRAEAISQAAALNDKALDECKQALNSIEFLRRYNPLPRG